MTSFFTGASVDKSPFTYLFEGLFPNLARYLAGGSSRRNAEGTYEEVLPNEISSIEGGTESRTQASSTPRQRPDVESLLAKSRLNTTVHLSRAEISANFDDHPAKHSNRRSLPALTLPHTRNCSTSSDKTLVWSPSGPPTTAPPAASHVDQHLKDAAERVVRQKQADEIRRLRQVVRELKREKDDKTRRAEGLQKDLAISETSRQTSLDMAIQYYRKQGNPFLGELGTLSERVKEMRLEIRSKDNLIQDQNRVIESLGREVILYADKDHWILMQQRYYDLQQRYEQMPADLRLLERRYGDLEYDYDDLYTSFRNLEAELTVLRAELGQVQDERDQFEYDASVAEEQSENAVAGYRRMEVERNEVLDQKAKSEEKAEVKERLLADLANRSFKRTIILSCMLDDFEVETCDDELVSLCQLAQEHLGIDYKELYKDFVMAKARVKRDEEARGDRDEGGVPEADACNTFSSAVASNFSRREPTHHARSNRSSSVNESPNTYDARRRREVSAAEEAILGPLGLGFEDGSPTLKTIPKSSRPSKVTALVPTSPVTPIRTRKGLFASGAGEIDHVTPARTGGTGGIARDQWQIAGDDLHELTQVFRGPRMHPVDVVSQEATKDEEEGSGGDRDGSPSNPEGGACLSPNRDVGHEDDLEGEAAVEGDPIVSGFSPETPLTEGSRLFQDLGMGNENVQQDADAVLVLPKEAFKAPKFEDFIFGKGGDAIQFTGSANQSSALAEVHPASPSSSIFNMTSASNTRAPVNAYAPPTFGQNFNFGGSNTAVSFTASQAAPSSQPALAPELESAAASSVLDTSLGADPPAVTTQAEDEVLNEEASDKAIEEDSKEDTLSPNKQMNKKAKAKTKKAEEKAQKAEERKEAALEAKGPNREQRRAASRERKAQEKKAQTEAKKAQSAAAKAAERRRAVATARMGA